MRAWNAARTAATPGNIADAEIDKLADKRVKAFFLVNPSNPPSSPCAPSSMRRLVNLVKTKRPDLIIITDDVYGTFVPGFRSADGRAAAEHDRRLLLLQTFRLHRLAAGRDRGSPEQHLRPEDREAARQDARRAEPPLQSHHPGAGEGEVHRPHGGGQPHGGAESHRRPVAAAADPDDAVLVLRAARQVGQLQSPLPAHRAPAVRMRCSTDWA